MWKGKKKKKKHDPSSSSPATAVNHTRAEVHKSGTERETRERKRWSVNGQTVRDRERVESKNVVQ